MKWHERPWTNLTTHKVEASNFNTTMPRPTGHMWSSSFPSLIWGIHRVLSYFSWKSWTSKGYYIKLNYSSSLVTTGQFLQIVARMHWRSGLLSLARTVSSLQTKNSAPPCIKFSFSFSFPQRQWNIYSLPSINVDPWEWIKVNIYRGENS